MIIMMAPEAVQLLKEHGSIILIDGTFEICEVKLVLTTIMIIVNDFGLPVAWLLSDSR